MALTPRADADRVHPRADSLPCRRDYKSNGKGQPTKLDSHYCFAQLVAHVAHPLPVRPVCALPGSVTATSDDLQLTRVFRRPLLQLLLHHLQQRVLRLQEARLHDSRRLHGHGLLLRQERAPHLEENVRQGRGLS